MSAADESSESRGRPSPESLEEMVEKALSSKEPLKKPKAEPVKPQGLLEKIILSRWTAPISAIALGTYFYRTMPVSETIDSIDKAIQAAVFAGLGYLTASLLRQDWLLRKAESVRRKMRPLPLKLLNLLPEHPEIVAGGIAAYFAAKLVSPMFTSIAPSDILRHPTSITIAADLSAYIFSTVFSISYPTASLALGRVFRQETAKTLLNAAAAAVNAYRGAYQKAADNLAELLESQRSYSKTVALQTLIGDLQLLSENLSCFDTYTNALATEKTSYGGRSDWVLKPFISFIKDSVVKKAKIPQWAEAEDLSYLIAATHAFSEGNIEAADTLLASAVSRERHSLIAHQARAALMRRTGRHSTADLEMMVTGELLMQEKDPDLEEVEGGRSRVLRKGRVILKLNEERAPLEDERKVTRPFREEFGQEVIYPLPTYKRSSDYALLSERDVPETLLDFIMQRKARLEDFAQAQNLLIRVQKFGYGLYKAKKLPLDESILRIDFSKPETLYFTNRRRQAIERIERFNGLLFPESYKDAVTNGLLFADRRLASYPHLTMSKDNNPGNVLKRLFGLTQLLDFELRSLRVMPPQIDFVALTEFAPYLTPQQIRWLLRKGIADFEDVNDVKLDRDLFFITYEDGGLQWHFERLIYRSGEAAVAKNDTIREMKMKQQVRHYLTSRKHIDTIIEEQHVTGKELEGALRAREELERPIFADRAEYDRLCRIVEREEKELQLHEPLPISKTRLALASAGAAAFLTAATIGGVSIRNNLIPFINAPVFPQGDKVLLAVSGESEGVTRQHRGFQEKQFLGINYYVIDAASDRISFLTAADDALNTSLSEFQDKAVFIKDGHIVLYDFIKRQFRTVEDDRFQNPAISPNGLWIASHVRTAYISPVMTELWFIRPADMKTRQPVEFPNSYLNPSSFGSSWSQDGSYIAFLSNNESVEGKRYPDSSKVWINSLNFSTGQVFSGPIISDRGRGVFSWSGNGTLAYVQERTGQQRLQQQIYLTDKEFKSSRVAYVAGERDMLGYNTESIGYIAFAGSDNLIITSTLLSDTRFKFLISILNLKTAKLNTLDGTFLQDVSRDGMRLLFTCGTPSDMCELDLNTGSSRNLTNTPHLRESGIYSPDAGKIYVIAAPAEADCSQGCPTSLLALDLQTGTSRFLRHAADGNLRYSLITK